MSYEYHREAAPASPEGVADIYVVSGVEPRPQPSRELLIALQRLSPAAHTMIQELISVGFQAMVKK